MSEITLVTSTKSSSLDDIKKKTRDIMNAKTLSTKAKTDVLDLKKIDISPDKDPPKKDPLKKDPPPKNNKRELEKQSLATIIKDLSKVRLTLSSSEGQGFLYNAEATIMSYLRLIDKPGK
jgi:hypothetical protein